MRERAICERCGEASDWSGGICTDCLEPREAVELLCALLPPGHPMMEQVLGLVYDLA